jgi:Flp pilus assembly protein TadG
VLGQPTRNFKSVLRALGSTQASQLLEFAVALPLLVVFVVGIFDFGGAFNLKQKLNNAAREGARFGSSLPTNDLLSPAGACGAPSSVCAIRDLVDSYLRAGRVNDCSLSTQSARGSAATMTWSYSAFGNACPGTLTLTIERGYSFVETVTGGTGSTNINVISTRVTVSYPYKWHFNNVIQLLAPGASYAGVTQISTDAIAPNMD